MNRQKVLDTLAMVDMTKIDLSSFKMGSKKFDALAEIYTRINISTCARIVIYQKEMTEDEKAFCSRVIEKYSDNPQYDYYDNSRTIAKKIVEEAMEKVLGNYRGQDVNSLKIKSIEDCIKRDYKRMRKIIEALVDKGEKFEYEFDDDFITRCFILSKKALFPETQEDVVEESVEQTVPKQDVCSICEEEPKPPCEEVNTPCEERKVSIFQRLFAKKQKA